MLIASPKLIADCYALHRLFMPSHPPYALTCFNHPDSDHLRSGGYIALVYCIANRTKISSFDKTCDDALHISISDMFFLQL